MRFARGVGGHAPPRNFFKMLQFGAFWSGAPNKGGLGGSQPPLNFGWGVEHLSTPPDFEENFFRGGWLPLN